VDQGHEGLIPNKLQNSMAARHITILAEGMRPLAAFANLPYLEGCIGRRVTESLNLFPWSLIVVLQDISMLVMRIRNGALDVCFRGRENVATEF
jgi:hypothetical protein